jgi:hypothetical protein
MLTKVLVCLFMFCLLANPVQAQDRAAPDGEAMEERFLGEFNRIMRQEIGARALARNPILDEVAQEIADLLGCTDDRVEFDIQHEVAQRGYGVFPGDDRPRTTRVPLLPAVNFRPIEEMAQFYTEDIFENNINKPGRFYREIGVGVSPCIVVDEADPDLIGSTQQYGLFVILGSQPDVIPVVIENGTSSLSATEAPLTVNLSIHQENSRQQVGIFGRGDRLRLSNAPLTEDDDLENYQAGMEWEFEDCGANTLYYELTDTEGLTLEGEVSVEVLCGS